MKKALIWFLGLVFLGALLVALVGFYKFNFTDGGDILPSQKAPNPQNSSFVVNSKTFNLIDGSTSSDGETLRIFNEPVFADLDKDGDEDAAILLVHESGGSGTFYYAALAMREDDSFRGTNTLFLGDRIAPQNINIENGRAVFNYAVRDDKEPITTRPSIGKSLYIHYDKNTREIGEWVKDFEGESEAIMKEQEARIIAEKTCIKGGEALSSGNYNRNTKTWWFDANLNATKPGCNPVCVVNENTRTAEINWRCTGAISP